MILYLIRHTPVAVAEGTCYGATDVPLTSDWAERLQALLRKIPTARVRADNVYTSPLQRCLTLAENLGPSPRSLDQLKEMNFGDWEGKLWSELPRDEVAGWLADLENTPAPGGESLGDVLARGRSFLELIERNDHDTVFAITHGGVVRCLLAHALKLDLRNAARLHIDYGGVSRLRLEAGWTRVEYMNV